MQIYIYQNVQTSNNLSKCEYMNNKSNSEEFKPLGELEQLILLAILQSDNHAYGMQIADVFLEKLSREISLGSLYTTLSRMEKKGLVESELGESSAQRGGRAKKYFIVSALGKKTLKYSVSLIQKLSHNLSLNEINHMGTSV